MFLRVIVEHFGLVIQCGDKKTSDVLPQGKLSIDY